MSVPAQERGRGIPQDDGGKKSKDDSSAPDLENSQVEFYRRMEGFQKYVSDKKEN